MNTSFRDNIQFVWDATSIQWASTCPTYYKLVMLDHWEPRFRSEHLTFGLHYAKALERFHKLRTTLEHEDALRATIRSALIDTWTDDGPWISVHPAKTRENLIRSIIWYIEQFREDTLQTVILENNTPAVEHSFLLEVDHGIMFSGHIDRLVTMGGDYYVTDQKTTGHTISRSFFAQFDMSDQMSMYTYAGQIVYDKHIHGVVIDAAQIAVGFTSFERGFTHRSEEQLEEWYDDTIELIQQTQEATASGRFRMNRSSCDKFGGCQFRSVCSLPKSLRPNMLAGDFVKREPWDPLKRR